MFRWSLQLTCDLIPDPPCSPDSTPSDYNLFGSLQNSFIGVNFNFVEPTRRWQKSYCNKMIDQIVLAIFTYAEHFAFHLHVYKWIDVPNKSLILWPKYWNIIITLFRTNEKLLICFARSLSCVAQKMLSSVSTLWNTCSAWENDLVKHKKSLSLLLCKCVSPWATASLIDNNVIFISGTIT